MLKNIIANIVGKFWSIVSSFIFVPLYIKYLGIENYSVISFTLMLVGLLAVMDAGLTATLSREFAKTTDNIYRVKVFHTLEYIYFAIVALIVITVALSASFIAQNWMHLGKLNPNYVAQALRVFAVILGLQFLSNFYIGGFLGLEKQVKANLFQVVWGVSKNALVVLVIFFYSNLLSFFIWQLTVTIIYILFIRHKLLSEIVEVNYSFFYKERFDKTIFNNLRKFIGGMFVIAMVAALNMQIDKLFISKLLPINELGYYSLAVTLSTSVLYLITPVSVALLPKFTFYFNNGLDKEANNTFESTFYFVSVIISVFLGIMVFFGDHLIFIWTGSWEIAHTAQNYLTYSVIGCAALAFQVIPYDIAISNGNTKINNYIGIVSLFFTIPCYYFGVKYFGALGAALTWCISQSMITPLFIFFVIKKHLKNQSFFKLIFRRLVLPILFSIFVCFVAKYYIYIPLNRILGLFMIALIGLIVLMMNLFITSKQMEKNIIYKLIRVK